MWAYNERDRAGMIPILQMRKQRLPLCWKWCMHVLCTTYNSCFYREETEAQSNQVTYIFTYIIYIYIMLLQCTNSHLTFTVLSLQTSISAFLKWGWVAQLKVITWRTLKHLEVESTSDSTFSNSDLKPYWTVVYYKDLLLWCHEICSS